MEWNQLLECYRGQGSYLLCQLPLVEKYDLEPMAREMLARIVAYAAGPNLFSAPVKTLKVITGDPGSATVLRLRDSGVRMQMAEPTTAIDENTIALLDAGSIRDDFKAPVSWKAALGKGAIMIVHGAVPAQTPSGMNLDAYEMTFWLWAALVTEDEISSDTPASSSSESA